ncbi:MAG TPA: glycosyltransferase [Gemmatimonadaceae bacterium]|nr:glycosyltransferase [Gemmatimonadaceae bacterium]
MERTVLVVPCYNEAARLPEARFQEFAAHTDDVELLFVDDGSTDRTAERLTSLCDALPGRMTMLRLPQNRGKGEAVRTGLLEAFRSTPTFAGYWDADLATPLSAVLSMRDVLQEHPHVVLVLGSRVQLLGRHIERRAVRHYAGRVFATMAGAVLGVPVYDTQCGAKLFRVTDVTREVCATQFMSPWLFDVELLARLIRHGAFAGESVHDIAIEFPLAEWRDVAGSKIRARHLIRVAEDLARIAMRYHAPRRAASALRPAAPGVALPVSAPESVLPGPHEIQLTPEARALADAPAYLAPFPAGGERSGAIAPHGPAAGEAGQRSEARP